MAHFKKGDKVTVTRGPHAGDAHEIIHVHPDGSYNVKPHNMPTNKIKYRLGAAKAKHSDVKKLQSEQKTFGQFKKEINEKKKYLSRKDINRALASQKPSKKKPTLPTAPWDKKDDNKKPVSEIARSMTPMKDKFGKSKAEKEAEKEKQKDEAWRVDSGWKKPSKERQDKFGNVVKDKNVAKNLARKAMKNTDPKTGEKVKTDEAFDFRVNVDGFPEMFMSGNSPGEVKTALRKLVKQPSMIKSVDRVTKAEKKKEFRQKVREGKTSGEVDYGSDESVRIIKKNTPGQTNENGPGLWANIAAKRARGEKMRKKGAKGAPTDDAIKRAQGKTESTKDKKENFFSNMYNKVMGNKQTASTTRRNIVKTGTSRNNTSGRQNAQPAPGKRNIFNIPGFSTEAKDPRLARAGVGGFNKAKRTPGHPTKSHIVVAKDGNKVKTIRFGQQGASTAGDPKKGESDKMKKKRASFKARHGRNIAKGKMSAAYWANKEKW